MSNWPSGVPGRRIKDARGFKVKVFDVLQKRTYWYSKTYSSLRNVKLAIAQGGFNESRFLNCEYRSCVELYIYDVETWKLAAVRRRNGGTDIDVLNDCNRWYWSSRSGEWEDNVQEEQK